MRKTKGQNMKEYVIKFMWDGQEVTGEYDSRVGAMANAQTISRRFDIRTEVYHAGNLVRMNSGRDC